MKRSIRASIYGGFDRADGWTDEDIELYKSIDWRGRGYEEYPVPEDNFISKAVLYGYGKPLYKNVKFIKYIRGNSIYPPYYAPEVDKPWNLEGYVGPMYDGHKHGSYQIHDRYESQEVYDMLMSSTKTNKKGIKASRLDEVRRQKAEWEAEYAPKKAEYEAQHAAYDDAMYAVKDSVQSELEDDCKRFPLLDLTVRVDAYGRWGSDTVSARIECDEYGKNPATSLRWRLEFWVNRKGEVERESGSWSGLDAVTSEQIENLKESVKAIEYFNNLNWVAILKKRPNYNDYITMENPDSSKPNFDRMEKEATLEDLVGSNTWFYADTTRTSSDGKGWRGYFNIVKDSGTQYTVRHLSTWAINMTAPEDLDQLKEQEKYTFRVRKSNFIPAVEWPLKTI